jgi:hypothetical protein
MEMIQLGVPPGAIEATGNIFVPARRMARSFFHRTEPS